jgi:Phosphotransferase enzyme family
MGLPRRETLSVQRLKTGDIPRGSNPRGRGCLGLPVPTVWSVQQIEGRWGIVFDRLSGVSFAEQMRSDAAAIPEYLQILARLHTRIHAHTANQFSSLKGWLATSITRAMPLDKPRKQILLDGLKDMPDGDRLCHGDFHPMNVLGEASQPMVIDWPNACRGDPAGDVCRSYLILNSMPMGLRSHISMLAAVSPVCRAPRSSTGWCTSQRPDWRKTSPESNIAYSSSYGRCD